MAGGGGDSGAGPVWACIAVSPPTLRLWRGWPVHRPCRVRGRCLPGDGMKLSDAGRTTTCIRWSADGGGGGGEGRGTRGGLRWSACFQHACQACMLV